MAFNLTNENFETVFNSELISQLLSLYCSRITETSESLYSELFKFSEKELEVASVLTNLLPANMISYKGTDMPLLLITEESLNTERDLTGDFYIQYHHLKSYYNIPPIIINVSKIKCIEDFENEFQNYIKRPKTGYKKYLNE